MNLHGMRKCGNIFQSYVRMFTTRARVAIYTNILYIYIPASVKERYRPHPGESVDSPKLVKSVPTHMG